MQSAFRHVYVHVPFCSRRCTYCDFSIAVRKVVPSGEYSTALVRELTARGVLKSDNTLPALDTMYFGGGTPSKLGGLGIQELIAALGEAGVRPADGAEVTIEANPEDVEPGVVDQWVRAGVGRLSVGIQSFDQDALSWMHRTHSSAQATNAVKSARMAGIGNVSIDLIYALPDSVRRSWRDDLSRALDLQPDHMSVYGLTVEPQTPLGRLTARGAVAPSPADRAADEFLEAHETLTAAGFEHYEVSNYAKPGFRSRHNAAYWRRTPYLGLGPSAHSFDGAVRRWNIAGYAAWAAAATAGADPIAGQETLGEAERMAEEAYLGLRTDAGFEVTSAADIARVGSWEREGWAVVSGRRVRLTPEGWLRLDALASSLSVA